ncbi:MAG: histidine phosphatase family protein [Clostridia bacterium]|nr:histidine phosphatase family protein [Clostridia bacterium]
MTEVYFVRHAEPNFKNHDDLTRELTEKGMRDRLLVTKFLWDKQIAAVFSSPYKRAVDTVQDFADRAGLTVQTDPDLRERRVDSVWIEDFDAFCKQQWADFDYRLTDGETLRMVQTRNLAALRRILAQCPEQAVAVGSHGTALSTLIRYFDPTFGHADFVSIQKLMPWIVRFTFDGTRCTSVTEYDVFTGQVRTRTPAVSEIRMG